MTTIKKIRHLFAKKAFDLSILDENFIEAECKERNKISDKSRLLKKLLATVKYIIF